MSQKEHNLSMEETHQARLSEEHPDSSASDPALWNEVDWACEEAVKEQIREEQRRGRPIDLAELLLAQEQPRIELKNLFQTKWLTPRRIDGCMEYNVLSRLQMMGRKRRINLWLGEKIAVTNADVLGAFNFAQKRGWKNIVICYADDRHQSIVLLNFDQYHRQRQKQSQPSAPFFRYIDLT